MTQVEYRKLDSRLYAIESMLESIQEMLLEYVGKEEDQRQQSFEFDNEKLSELKSLFNKFFSLGEMPEEDESNIDYEQIAKTAHEAANAVINFGNDEEEATAWEHLSAETKERAIDSASYIYHDDNITPQNIHEMIRARFKDGDDLRPDLTISYDELENIDKIKYIVYLAVIKSFKK